MSNQIDGEIGDDADQAAIGSNIKQDKTIGGQAVVNVNVGSNQSRSESAGRASRKTGISMAEANALWESINRLSEAVGGLKASIEVNSRETGKLAGAVDSQAEKFQVIDKAIATIQISLSKLGITPESQREPKWKTNLLVGSSTIIALCALVALWWLMFGGA
jgi:hypothetical protein